MEVPYHYQFRIIVIGDTMVGKSSLLKTFSEGSFGEMEPTVGVDFFSKIIAIKPKDKPDDNIIVKLQIWDTAGQERFKSIVTSYYRNSVGIVLVYDVTNKESYDHLIDWFDEARRHVEPSPQNTPQKGYPLTSTPNNATPPMNDSSSISFNDDLLRNRIVPENYTMAYLVLGCKTDLDAQRQVSFEDGKALADSYGFKFIETSSKTHHNVDQAFQLLAEEIYDRIIECGRLKRLYRTASGGHLTFDGSATSINEGIRIGPLIETSNKRFDDGSRVRLLEAQPVSGFLGGCC